MRYWQLNINIDKCMCKVWHYKVRSFSNIFLSTSDRNLNFDKIEYRSVIKLLFLKGLSDKEMFDDMLTTLAANVVPVSR
jgi:hypothetical protein